MFHQGDIFHTLIAALQVLQPRFPQQKYRHMVQNDHVHLACHTIASLTPRMNAAIFAASLIPLALSTPPLTSTA